MLAIAFVIQAFSSIPWYFKVLEVTPFLYLNFLSVFKSNYLFSHLIWFTMGMVFFVHREQIATLLRIYRWGLLTSIIFMLILGQLEIQYLMNASGNSWVNSQPSVVTRWLYSLLILGFAILLEKITPLSTIEFIGSKSYGIYLSHILTIEICARLIYHTLPDMLGQTIIFLGILLIMGIGIPLLIMRIFQKTPFKTVYSYLWG